jgi:hypothetical protein
MIEDTKASVEVLQMSSRSDFYGEAADVDWLILSQPQNPKINDLLLAQSEPSWVPICQRSGTGSEMDIR